MDEIFRSEFLEHGTELCHKMTQPTEDMILARNARLRNNPGALHDLGKDNEGGTWGRQVASIPLIVWDKALRNGFDLNSRDSKVAEKELLRFLQTTDGKMCLVQGKN